MAQGDYLIQNQSFPSFRSDLNSTLEAINTSNSGTSRPSSAVAGTVWLDVTNATNPTLKFFDGTDDISLAQLDYSANTVNWLDSSVVADLVNDTTPQLGGDLDVNGNDIVSVSNGDITFTPDGTGKVIISGLSFPTSDGTADQVLKTDGAGNLSFTDVSAGATNPFRNILINGDMSIAQRGTSVSSITSSGYNTVDRFRLNLSSLGTWTQSQSTDVPSGQGFGYSQKLDCTTANASPSASGQFIFEQKIEAQNLQYLKKGTASAESLTLSFWVKSNKTGTYIAEIFDDDNARQISKSYTIDSASTWEKKTITYDGDTAGTLNNDNGSGLRVNLWLGAGSNTTSGTLSTTWTPYSDPNRAVGQVNLADSTANEWFITGIQLEAGTTASDFEFLPHDVNLQRCHRYYQKFDDTSGVSAIYAGRSYGATSIQWCVPMNCPLRASPSVSLTGTLRAFHGSGYNDSTSSMGVNHFVANQNLIALNSTGFSSIVDNRIYTVAHINNTIIEMSSEL